MYHYPKPVEDDVEVFPTVAQISDAMLKKVDPTSPILMGYLITINPSIETGVLLEKTTKGLSKKSRESNK